VFLVVLALFAAGFALFVLYEESMAGFPDGHRTELDRFMRVPHHLVGGASLLVSAFALYVAAIGHESGLQNKVIAVVVALHVLVGAELVGPRIAESVLQLDDGRGG
jgi:hypothetical protein